MVFTEKTHAFIAAKYYARLTESFGERGERAFIHAVQHYAMQRGRRMAQRAIRDGEELNQATYNYYGEWVPSEESKAQNRENKSAPGPDRSLHIFQCPWHDEFVELGLERAGAVYCRYLDSAISRGFNPELGFEVPQTLFTGDCCIQRIRTGDIMDGVGRGKNPSGIRSFEFHCAHAYWTYREVAIAIFGADGEAVADGLLDDLREECGDEAVERILKYRDTNFNVCDCEPEEGE